jgi:hypothetical protein
MKIEVSPRNKHTFYRPLPLAFPPPSLRIAASSKTRTQTLLEQTTRTSSCSIIKNMPLPANTICSQMRMHPPKGIMGLSMMGRPMRWFRLGEMFCMLLSEPLLCIGRVSSTLFVMQSISQSTTPSLLLSSTIMTVIPNPIPGLPRQHLISAHLNYGRTPTSDTSQSLTVTSNHRMSYVLETQERLV